MVLNKFVGACGGKRRKHFLHQADFLEIIHGGVPAAAQRVFETERHKVVLRILSFGFGKNRHDLAVRQNALDHIAVQRSRQPVQEAVQGNVLQQVQRLKARGTDQRRLQLGIAGQRQPGLLHRALSVQLLLQRFLQTKCFNGLGEP
ncbi:hypothetical protein SDC9_147165 [bioreactor metagenome]|uniref:Uncharacterized protein n=1 Tax=bioreactor metagenome TaxID=1076179 RepID=A0A645EDK9_9ZZZZ